jgi:cellulose synthase/poly-beta-1,6-N-acetylglucosamine synthase-like glycosyltransferase
MLLALQIAFWISLATVAMVYFGYPLTLLLLAPFRKSHLTGSGTPTVTLIISAFNEEAVIREKLENSLGLDYPAEALEILVISDGSEDGTDAVVASYADRGVVLCRQVPRRGKSAGLTQFVPKAKGEILVFSDANSMYEPDALRKLVRHFADPQVGFVSGYQRCVDEDSPANQSESLYWRYETWLKIQERRISSPVCGDGAILAIRAGLFDALQNDDIADTILPLKIVARGYRGIFDDEAVCYERTADDFLGEFRRRVRIVNRALGAVLRVPQSLNPIRVGIFAYELLVHKVLRWFVAFFLLAMLVTSACLAAQDSLVYLALLLAQLLFYATALLALLPGLRRLKPVYVTSYFCVANAAAALGVIRLVLGKRVVTWRPERTQRAPRLQPSDAE